MTRHRAIERVEVAVEIADSAEVHFVRRGLTPAMTTGSDPKNHRCAGVTASAGTGTSRSFLSQMKSFLL